MYVYIYIYIYVAAPGEPEVEARGPGFVRTRARGWQSLPGCMVNQGGAGPACAGVPRGRSTEGRLQDLAQYGGKAGVRLQLASARLAGVGAPSHGKTGRGPLWCSGRALREASRRAPRWLSGHAAVPSLGQGWGPGATPACSGGVEGHRRL